jgi:elongation factor 1 alpha-like protein
LAGLHLDEEVDEAERERERERYRDRQVMSMKQEELIAKVKKDEEESGKKNISLIVVGKCCELSGCYGVKRAPE